MVGGRSEKAKVGRQFREFLERVERFSALTPEEQEEGWSEFLVGFSAEADRLKATMHLLDEPERQDFVDEVLHGAHVIGGFVYIGKEVIPAIWAVIQKLI